MFKYLRFFNPLIYPEGFYKLSQKILLPLLVVWLGLQSYGLWGALVISPPDYQQGEAVRILYVHVPAAMLSMAIFGFMAASSAIFLIFKIKMYDIFARQAAPIGMVFTMLALATGSIWGKPMWGTWWVWDARLTAELILLFIYLAYIMLSMNLPSNQLASKACAVFAIIGAIDLPIIHYSVKWWQTLHQGSSLSVTKSAIEWSMLKPLLVMIISFSLFFVWVWIIRVRTNLWAYYGHQKWATQIEGR